MLPTWQRGLWALGSSALLHVLGAWWFVGWLELPDVGFSLQLPSSEVAFGVSDAPATPSSPTAAAARATAPAPRPAASPTPTAVGAEASQADAGVSTRRPRRRRRAALDAGMALDDVRADAGALANATQDAPTSTSTPQLAGLGDPAAPAGAQVALRVDLRNLRRSALAPSLRRALLAIPDWQALLAGASLQPVDDLDRLLIASADLSRRRLVIAGQHPHDRPWVQALVERMAAHNGKAAPEWQVQAGHQQSTWPNRDPVARQIAVFDSGFFVIARPQDLPAVLAVATGRQQTARQHHPLLSMPAGALASVEVEGAHHFVRGQRQHVPERLVAWFIAGAKGAVVTHVQAVFPSSQAAKAALDFWQRASDSYARHPLVALTGLDAVLKRARMRQRARQLRWRSALTALEVQQLIGLLPR
ncbi:MAG: hypothetical protein ACPGUV_05815 [Polyangiales bacterium]